MDNNGYNPSLFDTEEDVCYICPLEIETARHEILHGPNRQLSKYYGLWINVCPKCHADIHREDNGKFLYLKEDAQRLFEEAYPDKNFLEIFGRNYL